MRVLQCSSSSQCLTVRAQFPVEQKWVERTSRIRDGICNTRQRCDFGKRIGWNHVGIPPQTGVSSNSGSVQPWTPLLGCS